MPTTQTPITPVVSSLEKIFPRLTPEQIMRIASYGHRRSVQQEDILVQQGERNAPFFVVTKGGLEVVRPASSGDTLVTVLGPGQFSGEINMIAGRRTLVRVRAIEPSEMIELTRERLLQLVQTDNELGEIIMSAYILRRLNLLAYGLGDVVLVGSAYSAGTLRIKEFLTRNSHPFSYIDLDIDSDVQQLLDRFHVGAEDVPVVICRGDTVLRNPSNQQIADCLGFNESIGKTQLRDVVIVGAGPAGLAAAVYGASEGLDVLVLESYSPGGQAGSSSKIENYLGFPTGISGQDLAARAYVQAEKFGAQIAIAKRAVRMHCGKKPYIIELEDDSKIPARTVIIATGAEYRKLPLENLSRYEGKGIYYAATFVEAQYCGVEEVAVIGGGNSAGQAALFLSRQAKRVYILVRGRGLADSMSRYLIRRIEESPNIELLTGTEVTELKGDKHLEQVKWKNSRTEAVEEHAIRHVFVMTGAIPNTGWLNRCVAIDDKGFIKTGTDLTKEDLDGAHWKPSRPPHLLETSLPGVFAVGDVRGGNIKRVASAVGEGSIVVSMVHQILRA